MLSHRIQRALERDVVGQSRAIQTMVRAVTVACSGLTGSAAPLGIYLFVGPSGTGKSHLARSVARLLHSDLRGLIVADCAQLSGREEWPGLARQVAPAFRYPAMDQDDGVVAPPPRSVLVIEHLEAAQPDVVRGLVATLETGRLMLPDGKCGSLRDCLVLMTSSLCSREIYAMERPEIGFSAGASDLEESEKARVYQMCCDSADKRWGPDLLAHVDDLIVFHRLLERNLPGILEHQLAALNAELVDRGVTCELEDGAREYLIDRSSSFLQHGAWFLVKVFRRFVLFPVADLVTSERVSPGSRLVVQAETGDRIQISVHAGEPPSSMKDVVDVPVEWSESAGAVE